MALLPSSPSTLLVLFSFAESVDVGMTNCLAGLILSLCGICLYQNALA